MWGKSFVVQRCLTLITPQKATMVKDKIFNGLKITQIKYNQWEIKPSRKNDNLTIYRHDKDLFLLIDKFAVD